MPEFREAIALIFVFLLFTLRVHIISFTMVFYSVITTDSFIRIPSLFQCPSAGKKGTMNHWATADPRPFCSNVHLRKFLITLFGAIKNHLCLVSFQDEKLDVSTPKMYSSFIPNGRAEPHLHTPRHQGLQLGDPNLNLSQVGETKRQWWSSIFAKL